MPGGAFVDAMAVLKVLHGASRYGDTALVSSSAIRARTRLGIDELDTLLEQMQDKGWVGRVRTDPAPRVQFGKHVNDLGDHWVLLANPETLTLADVYRLFVFGGMPVNAGVAQESSASDHRRRLDELAAEARLSPFHFARMFKQSVGVPPRSIT